MSAHLHPPLFARQEVKDPHAQWGVKSQEFNYFLALNVLNGM